MILHVLIVMIVGWIQRHQQQVITYLQEENRVLLMLPEFVVTVSGRP